jgi:Holliday junction resolvase
MSRMSREKGKRGEREFCELLREHGFEARRGQQFAGGPESPDVITDCSCHFEVKRTETFSPSYLAQAERDAHPLLQPVVVWKKNNAPWRAFMCAHHYLELRKTILNLVAEVERLQSGAQQQSAGCAGSLTN